MAYTPLRTLICALSFLAVAEVCGAADVAPLKTEVAKSAPKVSPAGKLTAKPGATPQKKKLVGGGFEVVTGMAGGLLKSVLGAAAKELLFPSKAIDPEKLLADITANVRKELIEVVMDGDGTALTAATTALHDYETEWKNGGDAGVLEGRVSADSTINGVNTVIARMGADGKTKYTSIGLPLYLAAAQIKANRLELRRKLTPAQDAAIRAVLVEHLDGAIRHARATMTSRRMASMSARLGKIAECRIEQERTHGLPWNLITTYQTSFYDSGYRHGGSQADGDSGVALARCEGYRDPYFDNVRRETQPGVDKDWVATNNIVDAWAQSLDVLRNQANVTSRDLKMDFGGMFGIGERAFNNPLTNAGTCPPGYFAYEFKGTYNVDWQAFYCGRISGSGDPVAQFGGMFGKTDHNDGAYWINNPITRATTCPAGFEKATVNNQHELNYCWRKFAPGDKIQYQFGGIYSDNGDKKNPVTGDMICPIGYTPALTHGTRASRGFPATRRTIICFTNVPQSL